MPGSEIAIEIKKARYKSLATNTVMLLLCTASEAKTFHISCPYLGKATFYPLLFRQEPKKSTKKALYVEGKRRRCG